MHEFTHCVRTAAEALGRPVDTAERWRGWFEERGFDVIEGFNIKMPMSPWPKDKRLKLVGSFEFYNIQDHMQALAGPLFTRGLGWSDAEAADLIRRFQQEVLNPHNHCYWPL